MQEPKDNSQFVLGQIDAKITSFIDSFKTHRDDIRRIIDAHDLRITRIERSYWKIAGIASAIPAAITIAGLLLT